MTATYTIVHLSYDREHGKESVSKDALFTGTQFGVVVVRGGVRPVGHFFGPAKTWGCSPRCCCLVRIIATRPTKMRNREIPLVVTVRPPPQLDLGGLEYAHGAIWAMP
ncbi:MAG TPA: hypothetical protein VLU99_08360 [Nitrososphaerales archaeon]|nr:hypothetical protein [Nitrososphaerales archaeon]HUK75791.1 hypothetical protein [Nitrososphaerales archaeon]